MTRLLQADAARLEEILDGTYAVWGEGLSRSSYSAWNRAQMATDWGRANLRRVALVSGETLLASAKRYDFRGRVAGATVAILGIGAVFTPVNQRGQGYARQLIHRMLEDAAARGCEYALLFSEIGAAYYEAMGFRVVPRAITTIAVRPKAGAPATFVRSGETDDLPGIAEITARHSADAALALERSPQLIAFGIARRRLLAGFGPAGLRYAEFFVAEEGYRPAAYVFITRGPRGVVLEECGDHDPTGARIGAILQVLAARDPSLPAMPLTGWLPDDLRPPQLTVVSQSPATEVMMIRALGSASLPADLRPTAYWQTDVF